MIKKVIFLSFFFLLHNAFGKKPDCLPNNESAETFNDKSLESIGKTKFCKNESSNFKIVCDCAKDKSRIHASQDKEAEQRLHERTVDFLVDQGKINLLDTLNSLSYLTAIEPDEEILKSCSMNKLTESIPVGCGDGSVLKNPKEVLEDIKKQFQNELSYRYDPSFSQENLIFNRGDLYKEMAGVIEKPKDCNMSEGQVSKMKIAQNNLDFVKLMKEINSLKKNHPEISRDKGLDNYLLEVSNKLKEKDGESNKIKSLHSLKTTILKNPVYSRIFKSNSSVEALISNFETGEINIDQETRKAQEGICKNVNDTIDKIHDAVCMKKKNVAKYIPKDFNSIKQFYSAKVEKENPITNLNSELNLACKSFDGNLNIPKDLSKFLKPLNQARFSPNFKSLNDDASKLKDQASLTQVAKDYWLSDVQYAQFGFCESITAEKDKLAKMGRDEYVKSCAERTKACTDDCTSARQCEDALLFADTFPELLEGMQAAVSGSDIKVDFTKEKKPSNILLNFVGLNQGGSASGKDGSDTPNGKTSTASSSKEKSATSKNAKNITSINSNSSSPDAIKKLEASEKRISNARRGNSNSSGGSGFNAGVVDSGVVAQNNRRIDDYIEAVTNSSAQSDSGGRSGVSNLLKTIPKKEKDNSLSVSPADVANVNKALLPVSSPTRLNRFDDDPEFAQDAGEGEGQFKRQSDRDKALEEMFEFQKANAAKVARGPASAGGGGASGGGGGGGAAYSGPAAPVSGSKEANPNGYEIDFENAKPVFEFEGDIAEILKNIKDGKYALNDQLKSLISLIRDGKSFVIKNPAANIDIVIKKDKETGELILVSQGNEVGLKSDQIISEIVAIKTIYNSRLTAASEYENLGNAM